MHHTIMKCIVCELNGISKEIEQHSEKEALSHAKLLARYLLGGKKDEQ